MAIKEFKGSPDQIMYVAENGAWDSTFKFFDKVMKFQNGIVIDTILEHYGNKGVELLKQATPRDTGKTAESWSYKVERTKEGLYRLIFENSNIVNEYANVAVLIDTGHLSKAGTWVEGKNYISPTLQPIFDEIANSIWKEIIET